MNLPGYQPFLAWHIPVFIYRTIRKHCFIPTTKDLEIKQQTYTGKTNWN